MSALEMGGWEDEAHRAPRACRPGRGSRTKDSLRGSRREGRRWRTARAPPGRQRAINAVADLRGRHVQDERADDGASEARRRTSLARRRKGARRSGGTGSWRQGLSWPPEGGRGVAEGQGGWGRGGAGGGGGGGRGGRGGGGGLAKAGTPAGGGGGGPPLGAGESQERGLLTVLRQWSICRAPIYTSRLR